jgi:hypothetical protein
MSETDPLASSTKSNPWPPSAGEQPRSAIGRGDEDVGAGLLLSDLRLVLLLLDEARYRVVARLFGVPRDKSVLVSVIALALLAQAARDKAARAFSAPGPPALGDSLIGAAVVKEAVYGLAGALPSDAPFLGTLVAIAVLGRSFRPAVRKSVHGVRASSHRARAGFDDRYGHLIRSNARRA